MGHLTNTCQHPSSRARQLAGRDRSRPGDPAQREHDGGITAVLALARALGSGGQSITLWVDTATSTYEPLQTLDELNGAAHLAPCRNRPRLRR